MNYLLFSILSATAIYICFRSFKRFEIPSFPAIVVNYFTAALLGFLIYRQDFAGAAIWDQSWFSAAVATGILFVSLFNLVSYTTRQTGISVTAIASKMSLVIPVAFFILADAGESLDSAKLLAIFLAVAGVVLSSLKKNHSRLAGTGKKVFLPLLLFIGSGILDTVLAFAEKNLFPGPFTIRLFVPIAFGVAGLGGVVWLLLFQRYQFSKFQPGTIAGGVILGLANFCSIFFLLQAYRSGIFEYSEVIPLNNVGIVAFSTLCGWLIFGEKLPPRNLLGLAFCAGAIGLLMWS